MYVFLNMYLFLEDLMGFIKLLIAFHYIFWRKRSMFLHGCGKSKWGAEKLWKDYNKTFGGLALLVNLFCNEKFLHKQGLNIYGFFRTFSVQVI